MRPKRRKQRTRDPVARALLTPKFRKRVVVSKRHREPKHRKEILE